MQTQIGKFIVAFDKSFKRAIESPENIDPDGAVNWNFVDADVYMDMCDAFGDLNKNKALHDLFYEEFDWAVSEEIECNMGVKQNV